MKIRNGFVSNSSSSSFVILPEGRFSTVKEVVKYIIEKSLYDYINESKVINNIKDDDTPIHFDVGGDETYVRKIDNKILIVTSQNIDLNELDSCCLSLEDFSNEFIDNLEFIDDYGEKIKIEHMEDFDSYYMNFSDFFILEHGIYGRSDYFGNCPDCNKLFSRGFVLRNGEKICACQIEKHKIKINRKNKLKKIIIKNQDKKS